jgi:hypothetical protein
VKIRAVVGVLALFGIVTAPGRLRAQGNQWADVGQKAGASVP